MNEDEIDQIIPNKHGFSIGSDVVLYGHCMEKDKNMQSKLEKCVFCMHALNCSKHLVFYTFKVSQTIL